MSPLQVTESNGRVRFAVRVQPRASRTEAVGLYGDALKVRLAAPRVDGAASEALVEFFAGIFNVAKRDVRLVSGESSRSKIVEIHGISERAIRDLAERGAR